MPAALIEPVETIRRLIAFDTTSRNSNLDLIRWVADYLDGFGIRPVLVHDETGAKANLFATLGPDADGGIVLSGHTDVVPVDGQDWSSDPWTLTERDGRLYGRGSADMKSFCALVLAKVPALIAAARERPFHIALSYDEEVGCLGIHGLLRHLRATGRRPSVVIIGEPTRMAVVNSHKGSTSVRTLVTGLASHSARSHQGVNAIAHAAELIAFLGRLGEELRQTQHDPRFEPPYSTLSATMIQGGTAGNIIPAECALVWDIRSLPGTDPEALVARFTAFAEAEVLPRMRALSERTGITTRIAAHVRALEPEPHSPAEALATRLTGANTVEAVSFATEGGFFQEMGIPTVVCGPGNIEQAHRPDEYIELSQVDACTGFLDRLAAEAARR